jgi:hypothetical protein
VPREGQCQWLSATNHGSLAVSLLTENDVASPSSSGLVLWGSLETYFHRSVLRLLLTGCQLTYFSYVRLRAGQRMGSIDTFWGLDDFGLSVMQRPDRGVSVLRFRN